MKATNKTYYSFERRGLKRGRFIHVETHADAKLYVFAKDAERINEEFGSPYVWIEVDESEGLLIAGKVHLAAFRKNRNSENFPKDLEDWKNALRDDYLARAEKGCVIAGDAIYLGISREVIDASFANYERIKAEKESERKAKYEAKEAARVREEAESLAKAKATIAAGGSVSGETLVYVARDMGIEVHPRTAGMFFKSVVSISEGSASIRGKRLSLKGWKLYRDCKAALNGVGCKAQDLSVGT